MIELKFKIQYDPVPLSGKAETMSKPWWMIATCEGDLTEYYAWFVKQRTGIMIQRPAWGAHISVIRGEEPPNKELWGKHQGKEITVIYDPDVRTNGEHWWMRVHSADLLDIREEIGLPKFGMFNLHLTIGRPIPRHEETSHYFRRIFNSYNKKSTAKVMTSEEAIKNFRLEALEVKHKELKRSGDSMFRSECPSCEIGILMMQRDSFVFKLSVNDYCTYCGRRFKYTDIKNSVGIEYI